MRNQVNIQTTKLEDVGTIIDLAVKAGANQVQGITFDTVNKAELQLKALQNAVRQARQKAEAAAVGAGVTIKEVYLLLNRAMLMLYTEALAFRASAADAAKTPITPGDVEIRAG